MWVLNLLIVEKYIRTTQSLSFDITAKRWRGAAAMLLVLTRTLARVCCSQTKLRLVRNVEFNLELNL